MLLIILIILVSIADPAIDLIFTDKSLGVKKKGLFYGVTMALYSITWILETYYFNSSQPILNVLCFVILLACPSLFVPRGKGAASAVYMACFLVSGFIEAILLVLIVTPLAPVLGVTMEQLSDGTSLPYLCITAVTVALHIPILMLTRKLVDKLNPQRIHAGKLLGYVTIPVSQAVLLLQFGLYMQKSSSSLNVLPGIIVAVLVCIVADIIFFVTLKNQQSVQAMEERVAAANQQLDIQVSHYEQLQESMQEVSRLRHDFTNQLTAASLLLERSENEAIREQLTELQTALNQTRAARYSPNPMADAVLTAKAKQAEEAGVLPRFTVSLPSALPIKNAHLCGALSNLLDNAIRGVQTVEAGKRRLELEADIRSGYLVIRCVNSSAPPEKKAKKESPLPVHGLGQEILQKIAELYQGDFRTDYRDGLYTAVLSLNCEETE